MKNFSLQNEKLRKRLNILLFITQTFSKYFFQTFSNIQVKCKQQLVIGVSSKARKKRMYFQTFYIRTVISYIVFLLPRRDAYITMILAKDGTPKAVTKNDNLFNKQF